MSDQQESIIAQQSTQRSPKRARICSLVEDAEGKLLLSILMNDSEEAVVLALTEEQISGLALLSVQYLARRREPPSYVVDPTRINLDDLQGALRCGPGKIIRLDR